MPRQPAGKPSRNVISNFRKSNRRSAYTQRITPPGKDSLTKASNLNVKRLQYNKYGDVVIRAPPPQTIVRIPNHEHRFSIPNMESNANLFVEQVERQNSKKIDCLRELHTSIKIARALSGEEVDGALVI